MLSFSLTRTPEETFSLDIQSRPFYFEHSSPGRLMFRSNIKAVCGFRYDGMFREYLAGWKEESEMEGDLILIKVEGHFGQIFIHSLLTDFGLLVFESASVSAYCISLLINLHTYLFIYLFFLVYLFFLYTCLPVRPFTLPFEESSCRVVGGPRKSRP